MPVRRYRVKVGTQSGVNTNCTRFFQKKNYNFCFSNRNDRYHPIAEFEKIIKMSIDDHNGHFYLKKVRQKKIKKSEKHLVVRLAQSRPNKTLGNLALL